MYSFGEPLVATLEPSRSSGVTVVTAAKTIVGCVLGAAAIVLATSQFNSHLMSPTSISTFGPSGQFCVGSKAAELDADAARLAARAFVDTLGDSIKGQTYYPDASLQQKQWAICTIVQQCLVPKHGLAVGRLEPVSRTRFYDLLAIVLSDESYKRINVQQLSNLLLGEMQTWATSCKGRCAELDEKSGLLPDHLLIEDRLESHPLNASYDECARLNFAGRHTFWECEQSPRMLHHGNIDTATGRYYLGNVFAEPQIHARNRYFDFVSVYGSLEPGKPWGFRYSGHHFDLSFAFDKTGAVTDLPTFLGHNPLVVPQASPPRQETALENYLQWRNMAGIPQFPDAVKVVLGVSALLSEERGYVPLDQWDSTPGNGGLTLKGGKAMQDAPHVVLSELSDADFEAVWALIDYTLEFPRGARPRPEKAAFRKDGLLSWTTTVHDDDEQQLQDLPRTAGDLVSARKFFYVRAETPGSDGLLYFGMVNSLFSLMLESEPSNHLHSILIPKSYLA